MQALAILPARSAWPASTPPKGQASARIVTLEHSRPQARRPVPLVPGARSLRTGHLSAPIVLLGSTTTATTSVSPATQAPSAPQELAAVTPHVQPGRTGGWERRRAQTAKQGSLPLWVLTPASCVYLGPTPPSGLHLAAPASQERYPALGPRSARRATPGSTQQLAQADAACARQENIAAMVLDIALYVKLANTAALERRHAACAKRGSTASS
mmetsp:Transcript_14154/g.28891  ORF Transcript_14154/g.28891 Transcript_14154/m.28891 type:complete len:213 (-) Transcript_14154:892-1530(-)